MEEGLADAGGEPAALAESVLLSGPHAELSQDRCWLSCRPGGVAQDVVVIHNTGTTGAPACQGACKAQRLNDPLLLLPTLPAPTALAVHWRACGLPESLAEGGVSAPVSDHTGSCFRITPERCSVLPGRSQEFRVTFQTQQPGSALEALECECQPALLAGHLPRLVLRGLAVTEDSAQLARRHLADQLGEGQKARSVARLIERLLEDAAAAPDAPRSARDHPAFSAGDAEAFSAQNAGRSPPLYYQPGPYHEIKAAYGHCHTTLQAMWTSMVALEAEAAAAEAAAKTKGKAKKGEPEAPPHEPSRPDPTLDHPAEWNGGLAAAAALAEEAGRFVAEVSEAMPSCSGTAASEAAAALESQLRLSEGLLRLPGEHTALVASALRDSLLHIADEVESKGESVWSSLGQRPDSAASPGAENEEEKAAAAQKLEEEEEDLNEEEKAARAEERERAARALQNKWRMKTTQQVKKAVQHALVEDAWTRVQELEQAVLGQLRDRLAEAGSDPSAGPEERAWKQVEWIRIMRALLPHELLV